MMIPAKAGNYIKELDSCFHRKPWIPCQARNDESETVQEYNLKEIFNKGLFRGEIKLDQSLSAYTSLRIGGPVEVMVFPEDVMSLKNVLIEAKRKNIQFFVLF